ncbi:MAG: hypothetical protein KatS3mg087_0563 [Patescibacteria group bacterium]|nr:MAG: hypothetical protein KatS3mg087_0563 [Patescibacteria group bacterium]
MLEFLKALVDFSEANARIFDEQEYEEKVEYCRGVDLPPEMFLPDKDEFLVRRRLERECDRALKKTEHKGENNG